jgi:hypothetical protein
MLDCNPIDWQGMLVVDSHPFTPMTIDESFETGLKHYSNVPIRDV